MPILGRSAGSLLGFGGGGRWAGGRGSTTEDSDCEEYIFS